jgi:hypothetical protein
VDKMVQAGMLDALMDQVDSGDLQLTGRNSQDLWIGVSYAAC